MNPQISLQQFRRVLAALATLGLIIVGIVLRFDPPRAVWIAWSVLFIFLFDAGLYLHDFLPSYQAGIWALFVLIWFGGFIYEKHLAERLACPPAEYHGRLIASALPFPPNNACLRKKRSADTVFILLGSETYYIQRRGRWPVVNNHGHVLLSADFDDQGLAVS